MAKSKLDAAPADETDSALDKPAKPKAAKPAAKKAPAKTAKAAKPAATAAKSKLDSKPATKKTAKPKAEAKERAPRQTKEISEALAKLKKKDQVTYEDFATQHGFDIRAVRRTARKLRDEGTISMTKDSVHIYMSGA